MSLSTSDIFPPYKPTSMTLKSQQMPFSEYNTKMVEVKHSYWQENSLLQQISDHLSAKYFIELIGGCYYGNLIKIDQYREWFDECGFIITEGDPS